MADTNPTSQTNWKITSGDLTTTLTFQSSLSSSSSSDAAAAAEPLPLLLHSPSPDSSPCEITVNFAEKHELRQIYVRSTARVYEVYTASDLKSDNEYLCTVRCGVATRDGEVLRSLGDKDCGDENGRSEDDWVEVKVDGTSAQTKPFINSTSAAQDLFEATAEIDDANPCISVTLRLLSLQSKGCVCVDEIYVFGDPVDSESQESHNENSSSSALMAMFLPTLLQASKTTGLSSLNAIRKEKQFVLEDDLKETPCPSGPVIENQLKGKDNITDPHKVELKEVKGGSSGPSQPDTLSQAAKMESGRAAIPPQAVQMDNYCKAMPSKIGEIENNHSPVLPHVSINQGDFSGGNVERALENLLSRMDRLEEICLGFQEKMVVPMNSIEARLQRVEQQLDTLSRKGKNSTSPSCYRMSAPDASCIESDTNSCETCLDNTVTREIESDTRTLHTEMLNASHQDVSPRDDSPQDMSRSENTTQLLPGLIVIAPEFSEGEDEEDNASEQKISPSYDKGKLSIDDALSSALANFLSSSLSSECTKYTKRLHIKAPEFSNEDDDLETNNETVKNDSVCSTDSETVKNDLVHSTDSEKISPILVSDSSTNSLEKGENVKSDSIDRSSEKSAMEAEQYEDLCRAQGDQDEVCADDTLAEHSLRIDFNDDVEDEKEGKLTCKESDVFLSNVGNIPNEVIDSQTLSGYTATKAPKITFHDNIIENVLGFSLASPVVDFEFSLLDVKFDSQTSPITDGYLESLLVETPETSSRDKSVNESSEDLSIKEQLQCNSDHSLEKHSNLISVDEYEPVNPSSNINFGLVEDLCTSITSPVNVEGDMLAEDHKRKRDCSIEVTL